MLAGISTLASGLYEFYIQPSRSGRSLMGFNHFTEVVSILTQQRASTNFMTDHIVDAPMQMDSTQLPA